MSIATDPNSDTSADSEGEFDKHFQEFAAKRNGTAPHSEAQPEPAQPEGNDPEEQQPAPAPAAAEPEATTDDVTSGDAGTEGGTQPPPVEQAPDPLANLPEEARALVAQLQKERDEARHRAQSDANRVAALSRKLQGLTTQPPASAPAPVEEKSEAQKALDEKIKQLRTDYGDIADPLIELIENQRNELNSVRTVLTGLSEERQAQVIAAEEQALAERHPDWRDVARSEGFTGWLESQPENIQRLAQSWDARETSVVLTLFKAERAENGGQPAQAPAPQPEPKPKAEAATDARRSQQLDGGRDVRSRPAPAASGPPEDFDAAFAYFQAKREAKRTATARR